MPVPLIHFEEATHTYTVDGVVRPSVTQILSVLDEFSDVPKAMLDAAALFGQHVHMAVDLDNRRQLDEAVLDVALRPYLAGWRRFLRETGAKVLASEFRVWHPLLKYCGTGDSLLEWKGQVLCDVKTGAVPRSVGAQTIAYQKALLLADHDIKPKRRICVQLGPDTYKVFPQTDPSDWALFTSCLNVWRHRNVN